MAPVVLLGQSLPQERRPLLDDPTVQGKPVARRGRKARDLRPIRPDRPEDRPVAGGHRELDLPNEVVL